MGTILDGGGAIGVFGIHCGGGCCWGVEAWKKWISFGLGACWKDSCLANRCRLGPGPLGGCACPKLAARCMDEPGLGPFWRLKVRRMSTGWWCWWWWWGLWCWVGSVAVFCGMFDCMSGILSAGGAAAPWLCVLSVDIWRAKTSVSLI